MNPRIDDLIALAALGELIAPEHAELEAAAAADPGVARELSIALESAAALQSSPVEPPPPGLKASVMAVIAGVPQDTADEEAPDNAADEFAALRSDRRRRLAPLLAAAAALALVVGGAILATKSTNGDDDPIAAVVDADDAVSHSVTGTMGELEFVYSPGQGAFVLVGESLETPPTDSTYQVWLVTAGAPTSLGTFEPDDDGAMEMRADGVDPTGSTIAITVEPAGGSPQPTTLPVAESLV